MKEEKMNGLQKPKIILLLLERFRREPTKNDFRPDFGLYTDATCIDSNDIDSIVSILGERYAQWISSHKAEYHGFKEILDSTK